MDIVSPTVYANTPWRKLTDVDQFTNAVYIRGMKNFHDYFFDLSMDERETLAEKAGTTRLNLTNIAGGFKVPSLPAAVRLIRASKGKVTFESLIEQIEKRRGPF